jgi:DNA-binding PadR family transcriptional regulator
MDDRRRGLTNPLALAVLALLVERPMHPYEIASLMRHRAIHEAIKLNYGSLYTVVDGLRRHDLIQAQGTQREGRHPERTVYRLTEAGRTEFDSRLRDLLRSPAKEYTQFAAGLAFVGVLSPVELMALLEERARRIERDLSEARATLDALTRQGLPRLFTLEAEHAVVLRAAELDWVRGLVRGLADGSLAWPTPETLAALQQPGSAATSSPETGGRGAAGAAAPDTSPSTTSTPPSTPREEGTQ